MSKTSIPVLHLEPVGLHPVNCKGSSITFVLEPSFFNWTWNFRLSMFSKHLFGDRHAGSACTRRNQHKKEACALQFVLVWSRTVGTSEYWHQTLDFLAPYNVQVNICIPSKMFLEWNVLLHQLKYRQLPFPCKTAYCVTSCDCMHAKECFTNISP